MNSTSDFIAHHIAGLGAALWVLSIGAGLSASSGRNAGDSSLFRAPCGDTKEFINSDGSSMLALPYRWISNFSEGLAAVSDGKKSGFIDPQGHLVVPLEYSEVGDFAEGLARACTGTNSSKYCGYVNGKGEVHIPLQYNEVSSFEEGRAAVGLIEGGVQIIDREGRYLWPEPKNCQLSSFSEGYLTCQNANRAILMKISGEIVPTPPLAHGGRFREGLAVVRLEAAPHEWVFIDTRGTVIPKRGFERLEEFSEGLAPAIIDGLWGYVDRTGRVAIPASFTGARRFSNGLAAVGMHMLWGFVDRDGKVKIPGVFLTVYSDMNSAGLASVEIPLNYTDTDHPGKIERRPGGGHPTAYVDKKGRVVWKCAALN